MKILLVGNYSDDRQESMLRFSATLAKALNAEGVDVRLIQPRTVFGGLSRTPAGLGKWLGYVDKYLIFPLRLRVAAGWADIVHICDHSNAPYASFVGARPCLVTCHDLLAIRSAIGEFPAIRIKWSGRILQQWILSGLRRATFVACDSAATQADVVRLGACPARQTSIIPLGLNYPFHPMPVDRRTERLGKLGLAPDCRYLIHVGSNAWYKNRPGLIRIYAEIAKSPTMRDVILVVVGAKLDGEVQLSIQTAGLSEKVIDIGPVDDENLCALYSGASALVFPSLQEGFGWPVVEAQACGCPVFASNRPPMTEVGGAGADYFPPDDPVRAAEIVVTGLANSEGMRKRARSNAGNYTTAAMIARYLSLYRQLASQ